MSDQTVIDLALVTLLFFSSVYDLAQRRIPNKLLLIGLAGSAALQLSLAGPLALLTVWLAGFAAGLLLLLPLYILRAMAAGDVKLMATVGAFTGPLLAFETSLATYCIGGVLAFLMIVAKRRLREAAHNVGAILLPWWLRAHGVAADSHLLTASVGGMPYALAITLGSLLVLYLRHT